MAQHGAGVVGGVAGLVGCVKVTIDHRSGDGWIPACGRFVMGTFGGALDPVPVEVVFESYGVGQMFLVCWMAGVCHRCG